MRPKTDLRTASRESYKRFCAEYPQHKISYKDWCNVMYTWNDYFMTYILETGEKVKMPYGFGHLSINKKKTIKYYENHTGKHCILPIDWVQTKKYGKRIYNFNHHTDGFRFRWLWFKDGCRMKFADIWSFRPVRKYSRLLSSYLKLKKDKNYVDVYNEWYTGKSR